MLLYKYQKGNTLKISDPKEFAYRNKMYNDSLNLYKESEKARDEQFEKYNVQFTDFNKKDAAQALNVLIKNKKATKLEKNSNIKPIGTSKDFKNTLLIYKKPTQPVALKKAKPKKEEIVETETIIETPTVEVAKVKSKPITSYPVGYAPYSHNGNILDPKIYGYGESTSGNPIQIAQFIDSYGLKQKMREYSKDNSYPWLTK